MKRVQATGAVASLPATAFTGPVGYYSPGNPGSGIEPTLITYDNLNLIQETLLDPITVAGLTHSNSDLTQLTQAIRYLSTNPTTAIVAQSTATFNAASSTTHLVISGWTSANTDIDGLINGTTTGALIKGASNGHLTLAIDSNDAGDGLQVISKEAGNSTYTKLCFEVKANGTVTSSRGELNAIGPCFSVQAASTAMTAGTATKITFATEEFDTDNCFASNRFTPNKEGYYLIAANIQISGTTTGWYISFYKNSAQYTVGTYIPVSSSSPVSSLSNVMYFNGTTDYVEVYGVTQTALSTVASPVYRFNGTFLRGV